jgi:hypothetical protein
MWLESSRPLGLDSCAGGRGLFNQAVQPGRRPAAAAGGREVVGSEVGSQSAELDAIRGHGLACMQPWIAIKKAWAFGVCEILQAQ